MNSGVQSTWHIRILYCLASALYYGLLFLHVLLALLLLASLLQPCPGSSDHLGWPSLHLHHWHKPVQSALSLTLLHHPLNLLILSIYQTISSCLQILLSDQSLRLKVDNWITISKSHEGWVFNFTHFDSDFPSPSIKPLNVVYVSHTCLDLLTTNFRVFLLKTILTHRISIQLRLWREEDWLRYLVSFIVWSLFLIIDHSWEHHILILREKLHILWDFREFSIILAISVFVVGWGSGVVCWFSIYWGSPRITTQ